MLTRKIGSLLRGNATPAQLMLACVIGAMLGFMPSLVAAAGIIVLLTLALVILNANLLVAGTVGLLAKAISIPLMPASFAIGRLLLDGPTQPLFKAAINAPVLALFGFEYYATTGGLVMGLLLGVVGGVVLIKVMQGFRRKMAAVAAGSEAYKKWSSKGSIKALTWVFFGGGPKGGYAEALERKGGVIRPIGVAFALLLVGLIIVVQMFFAGPIITAAAQRGLEDANGATVDLASADLDLGEGRMVLHGLAMADPNALDTDVVRAERVEIDISSTDLLRKRARLDRVVLVDAQNGVKRVVPGRRIGPPASEGTEDAPPPADGERSIEDYIKDAQVWKDRLAQVRRWLESVSGSDEAGTDIAEKGETLEDRLRRRIAELGYARVAADHLITGAPTLTIAELVAEKVKTQHLTGETVELHAHNLSTHPHLLAESPSIDVRSSADSLKLALNLVGLSAAGGQSTLDFAVRKLRVDAIAAALAAGGSTPMTGGTLDALLSGNWSVGSTGNIDLPLRVQLRDTTLNLGGRSQKVSHFDLVLGLSGPMNNPRIKLDEKQLADALVKAGAGELANEAKAQADAEIHKATGKLTEKLGSKVPVKLDGVTNQAGDALKGLFGGTK